ncbi:MAG: RidA family protein [Clostridia bacterium]
MQKPITSKEAPAAIGPYSHGFITGNMIFTSGQLPIDCVTGKFVEGGIKEQTAQSIKNVIAVLKAADADLSDVVSVNVYLNDMNNFAEMNKVYAEYFTQNYPARTCVEVARLPKDALVEINVIATK